MSSNKQNQSKLIFWLLSAPLMGLIFALPLVYSSGLLSYNEPKFFLLLLISLYLLPVITYVWIIQPTIFLNLIKNRLLQAILLFIFVFGLTAVLSIDHLASFWSSFSRTEGVVTLLALLIVILGVATSLLVYGREQMYLFLKTSVLSGALVSILILFSADGIGKGFAVANGGATVGNSSLAAHYITWNIFFSLLLLWQAKTRQTRLIWGSVLAVILLSPLFFGWRAVLTPVDEFSLLSLMGDARGAIVALLISLLMTLSVYLSVSSNFKKKVIGLSLTTVLVLGVIVVAWQIGIPGSRVQDLFIQNGGENRLIFWKVASHAIADRPLFGWGPSTYDIVYHKYFDPSILITDFPEPLIKNPHNIIYQTLAWGGIALLLALLSFLGVLSYQIYKSFKLGSLSRIEAALLFGALICWFLQSQLVYDSLVTQLILFIVAGIVIALTTPEADQKKRYLLSSDQKIVIGSSIVLTAVLFIFVVILPYKKARLMNAVYSAPAIEKIQLWPKLSTAFPMGNGYDTVLLYNGVFESWRSFQYQLPDLNEEQKDLIYKNLVAMDEHLQSLLEKKNPHPQLALARSRLQTYRMALDKDYSEDQRDSFKAVADRSVELAPTDPRTYKYAAQTYYDLGDYDKVKSLIESAISLEPRLKSSYEVGIEFGKKIGDDDWVKSLEDRMNTEAQEPNQE